MQALPGDDQRSPPVASTERLANSSPPRPSRLKRWGDPILLGLVAATLIRVCSTLLASWLPGVEQLAQPGYVLPRWLAAFTVLAACLAIKSYTRRERTAESPSSCYSYYSVPKVPAVVSGLLFAEFFSNYRGTSLLLLSKMLALFPQPSTFGLDPLTMLAILIHSAGILTVAALGYSIHTHSKLTNHQRQTSK